MNLKRLISNKSHWTINKHLAKKIGLESTLILQHLIDYSEYHNKETIFQTYKQIQSALNLSEYSVKNGVPKLKELGFISTERKGMGYKNHYTIHPTAIIDFLTQPASEGEITPASEVSTKSPLSEGENNLSSEGEIDLPSEGENTPAINKNINNKNIFKKNIIEKYNSNSTERAHMDKFFTQSKPSQYEINELDNLI